MRTPSGQPAVVVEGLRKRYGDTAAVDGIDLRVEPGEVFGVLGRNGAGKTTAVELIAGLRRPDAGSIRVLGLDPVRDRRALRQVLGVQLQESFLHGALTVSELVDLYRSFYPAPRSAASLIASVGLTEQSGIRFEHLSGGQQQRLSIALAMVGRPRLVILDELTTGLDPAARRQMWAMIERLRDESITVVLVSHFMDEVERLCDRVAVLDAGRVLALDTPAGLVRRAGLGQRVTFRVIGPMPTGLLERLDEVDRVVADGDRVLVEGHGDLLVRVSTALVMAGVVATETRAEQATLDDAFLALTGHALGGPGEPGAA